MSIHVSCSSCKATLKAPAKAVGREARCPKCGLTVLIQAATSQGIGSKESPPEQVPATRTPPSPLIPCQACSRQIAVSSRNCPGCGAENGWIHPEIQRFIDHRNDFTRTPPFRFERQGLVLRGVAEVVRGSHSLFDMASKAIAVGAASIVLGLIMPAEIALLLWVIGPLAFIGGTVAMCIAMFQSSNSTDFALSFQLDFSHSPARWQSDDDHYWAEVKRFFEARG